MAVATIAAPKPRKKNAVPVTSVYRSVDGTIHHARCRQRMTYQGATAGGLELQFHCGACHERVVLPEIVASGLPVSNGARV